MSGGPYWLGNNIRLSYTVGSTASTQPDQAVVTLVVTDPDGIDQVYSTGSSAPLSKSVPSSDSTSEGWARWTRLVPATKPGRWTYAFRSTGILLTAASGAFAVTRPLASTST